MFYKNIKKLIFLLIGLSAAVLLFSGCGREDYESEFILGKSRIHCNGSTITVSAPFELIADGKQADLSPSDAVKIGAEGHNKNMQILVTGNKISDEFNVESLTKGAQDLLLQNQRISNLKTNITPAVIGESSGYCLDFSFTESSGARKTNLILKEYIFSDRDTVWRVIYQYREGDAAGKYLMDKVSGDIVIGSTF